MIGFEYGYNPGAIAAVIWEAQYGDFINGAQVMIDSSSCRRAEVGAASVAGAAPPAAPEGRGRITQRQAERFLQLPRSDMRVANCTTAAQYFICCAVRRAAHRRSVAAHRAHTEELLRHPLVGRRRRTWPRRFRMVIQTRTRSAGSMTCGVLVCTGKVYTDLVAAEQRAVGAMSHLPARTAVSVPMRDLRASSTPIRTPTRSSGSRKNPRTWAWESSGQH